MGSKMPLLLALLPWTSAQDCGAGQQDAQTARYCVDWNFHGPPPNIFDSAATCVACDPSCLVCEGGGAAIKPGYSVVWASWAASYGLGSNASLGAALWCPVASACLGAPPGQNGTCAQGTEGPLCAVCASGWARTGFDPYDACTECGEFTAVASVTIAVLGLFVAAPTAVYLASSLDVASPRDMTIQVFAKQAFMYGTILAQGFSCGFSCWPAPFSWLIAVLQTVFRLIVFDFGYFLSGCVSPDTGYFFRMIAAFLTPVILCVVLLVFRFVNPWQETGIQERCYKMFFILVFVMYPFLSITILGVFSCRQLGPDGAEEVVLVLDYRQSGSQRPLLKPLADNKKRSDRCEQVASQTRTPKCGPLPSWASSCGPWGCRPSLVRSSFAPGTTCRRQAPQPQTRRATVTSIGSSSSWLATRHNTFSGVRSS